MSYYRTRRQLDFGDCENFIGVLESCHLNEEEEMLVATGPPFLLSQHMCIMFPSFRVLSLCYPSLYCAQRTFDLPI